MRKKIWLILLVSFVLSMCSLSFAKVEKGMSGAEVQSVQNMLIDAGYLTDGADGVFGSGTEAAVKRFQADHGLDTDGIVGGQTAAALAQSDSSATSVLLQSGDRGDSVRDIQSRLSANGYDTNGIDGVYGSGTENAVRAFQQSIGVTASGVLDERTKRAVYALGNSMSSRTDDSSRSGDYRQRMVMDATAYSSEDPGNGPYTAGGNRLTHGYVSVDPNVIPLGTKLYIEGYGYALADDTGGAIVGNRIDLGMDSHREASRFGRKDVVVYIL